MKKKKESLINVLQKLKTEWIMAKWFLILLQSEYCDDKIINELSRMIFDSAEKTRKTFDKIDWNNILKRWLDIIKKIQQEELEDRESELQEIEDMLKNL
jgi:regulator of sirC expression with transglutaminase-like and TPR domain